MSADSMGGDSMSGSSDEVALALLEPSTVEHRTGADRLDALVLGWARWYTRDLPAEVATERIDELVSDLHDEREWAGASASRSIVRRWVRGIPADLAWRAARMRGVALTAPRGTFPRLVPAVGQLATALLLAWGVLIVARVAPLVATGAWFGAWDLIAAGAVGLALAVVGAVLGLVPGRRWLGGFWLAAAAYVLLQHGTVALMTASVSLGAFAFAQAPQAALVADLLTIAGVLGFIGAALWWIPLDRNARAESAR
ncbi:hypothetical protein [Agromyces indicus]|uniref:Uncharacterized protein n=1 Tax=Agromyces indicus TaxID=758919 RepID=A0ABU1FFC5_9MICO|nr:hypothetical protein [Agromyces indicus]MDR5690460.1 hypothetical protein [Agromyces indicus]